MLVERVPALERSAGLRDVTDDHVLLAIANHFAGEVASHRDEFAAAAFAVEDLTARIEAFVAAGNAVESRRLAQLHARHDMAVALACAMEAVETLDVVVPNQLASDAVTLAQWKRERQVYFNRWPGSSSRRRARRGREGKRRRAVSAS